MDILLINPPNSGRSIPEDHFGITSVKQIFRGEPLALEELAGNLRDHDVRILDLKVEPDALADELNNRLPDLVGITGVTCEAQTMVKIGAEVKAAGVKTVVVGGIHASNDPEFFNREEIDFIVVGLGKLSFRQLVEKLEMSDDQCQIDGVCRTRPGHKLQLVKRDYALDDLAGEQPPAYELVARYRSHYILEKLQLNMGFVSTAVGCPFRCSFCCIKGQAGGRHLTKAHDQVLRDISLLADIPVIRLIDANTFGNLKQARELGTLLRDSGLGKQFLADVRSDTVVNHPELMALWKEAGLRAVIIGFEEIDDRRLSDMNKANKAAINLESIRILHDLGVTIIGDFIISPDYSENDFQRLADYVETSQIDLPMHTVLTPLPGTEFHQQVQHEITNHDLDYYTLTNAVTRTRLPEETFYALYADLLDSGHREAKL
ncbi:MAG: radical SAM protein [Thermodesulfobacteriota bacterium]